jgi:hypothetical protein
METSGTGATARIGRPAGNARRRTVATAKRRTVATAKRRTVAIVRTVNGATAPARTR